MRKSRVYIILTLIVAGSFLVWFAFFRDKIEIAQISLPPAQPYESTVVVEDAEQKTETSKPTLQDEVNLKIPFVLQAPHRNWELPYQQFCEEASVLMAVSYVNNQKITDADDANARLLAIKDFEEKKFGFYEDTTIEETAVILREHFKMTRVEVFPNPTVDDIKNALSQGKAVIVPLAGQQLGNPYYQSPGPLYHMLVIKGYKKNGDFITNDPGTRRGADYIYKSGVIMNAIHDWNSININLGEKVMLIVG